MTTLTLVNDPLVTGLAVMPETSTGAQATCKANIANKCMTVGQIGSYHVSSVVAHVGIFSITRSSSSRYRTHQKIDNYL